MQTITNRDSLLIFCLLSITVTANCDTRLTELVQLSQHLRSGINKCIRGDSIQSAFAPWKVKTISASRLNRWQKKIERMSITSVKYVGFEVDLLFIKNNKLRYRLRSYVCSDGRNVGFFYLKGYSVVLDVPKSLQKKIANTSSFKNCGQQLLEMLQSKNYQQIPFARSVLKKFPRVFAARGLKDLEKTKHDLPKIVKQLESFDVKTLSLAIDDLTLFAQDRQGLIKGVFHGEWQTQKDGNLAIDIHGFQLLK